MKFSNRFTACSSYPIDMKLGRMIADISLHNRYEQDISGAGEDVRISEFLVDVVCTCSLVSPSQESLFALSDR